MRKMFNESGNIKKSITLLLIILPIITAFVCLSFGRMNLPIKDILNLFLDFIKAREIDSTLYAVVMNIRLLRIILALVVGAGMTVAGVTFQSLFSNPLATPDILGVTSATCVGAIIAILNSKNIFATQIYALIFGLISIWITLILGRTKDNSIINLILSGIIISSVFNAVSSILKYTADPTDKLPEITYWLMGSLSGASYKSILFGAPLIIIGILLVYVMRWRLNVLTLSEEEAKSTGIDIKKTRVYFILASTIITASSVSMCGQIGWIGLIVPHISRMLVGSNNRYVVPFSISLGAIFLIIIDSLSRSVSIIELPLSVLTAIIGAPTFILLLKRKGVSF